MNIGPPSSSSTSADRSDGPPASLREALRAGVLEYWSVEELMFDEDSGSTELAEVLSDVAFCAR